MRTCVSMYPFMYVYMLACRCMVVACGCVCVYVFQKKKKHASHHTLGCTHTYTHTHTNTHTAHTRVAEVIVLDIVHPIDELILHTVQTSDNFALLGLAQTVGLKSKKRVDRSSSKRDEHERFQRRRGKESPGSIDYEDPYLIGVRLISQALVDEFHVDASLFGMGTACGYSPGKDWVRGCVDVWGCVFMFVCLFVFVVIVCDCV
jgi:hypothetical protein